MKKQAKNSKEWIQVRGARTHNLKNIDVDLPRNQMTAITGLSGSGKSSLAFDTIFAEGQRRYVESLSAYARQFLEQAQKPDVDEITGLSPAISIDQKSRSNNPRSTVATVTEIYDYLRVLFARIGRPHSPISGHEIRKLSLREIVDFAHARRAEYQKTSLKKSIKGVTLSNAVMQIYAPMVRGRKGEYYQLLYDMLGKGFEYARIDGVQHKLRERIDLTKTKKHDIDFLVDEIAFQDIVDSPEDSDMRLSESVEKAVNESDGLVKIIFTSAPASTKKKTELGESAEAEFLLSAKLLCPEDGFVFPEIEPRLFSFNSPYGACPDCNGLGVKGYFNDEICKTCNGARLRPESLHVFIGPETSAGKLAPKTRKNILDFTQMSISDAYDFLATLKLTNKEKEIADVLIREIVARLEFMSSVGLEYLTLDRRANTLSGGEAQRIRLASQLGSRLVGALYVLDEPTIGLHPNDNRRLINTLCELRDLGNTILVVEHDEETILASDYLIEIGPGAGEHGGELIVSDNLQKLLSIKSAHSTSRTLPYLRREKSIPFPASRRSAKKGEIKLTGAKLHNLQNLNTTIPLGKLVVISGISGSGKSSLVHGVLEPNLLQQTIRRRGAPKPLFANNFEITAPLSRVITIDQSPIGRTPRSNPSTYTGAFTHIRDLFAATDEAQIRGWKPGRFSFNVPGGRCEACEGRGEIAVEMHFLPTIFVACDVCHQSRYDRETLKVHYKGKSIAEVLNMSVEEAVDFFSDIPSIFDRLETLYDAGLGYLRLGQSANTLSGGESQRVKIASELYRPNTQNVVYILDEPTVGLHYDDVSKLLVMLNKLVDRGNTVIVIEHNLDFIKNADYVLDLGPGGGDNGGKIVATGTPEQIHDNPKSVTGPHLFF